MRRGPGEGVGRGGMGSGAQTVASICLAILIGWMVKVVLRLAC